jgi:hypothetical protein
LRAAGCRNGHPSAMAGGTVMRIKEWRRDCGDETGLTWEAVVCRKVHESVLMQRLFRHCAVAGLWPCEGGLVRHTSRSRLEAAGHVATVLGDVGCGDRHARSRTRRESFRPAMSQELQWSRRVLSNAAVTGNGTGATATVSAIAVDDRRRTTAKTVVEAVPASQLPVAGTDVIAGRSSIVPIAWPVRRSQSLPGAWYYRSPSRRERRSTATVFPPAAGRFARRAKSNTWFSRGRPWEVLPPRKTRRRATFSAVRRRVSLVDRFNARGRCRNTPARNCLSGEKHT